MLKIYGRANSINVRKVLWVADELGLKYEREDWGRGFKPTDSPEFKKLNPMAVVPVIDDEGFILRESNAITRYLAAKGKREDLYPSEVKARAVINAWMDWGATDLYWGVRPVFIGLYMKLPAMNDPKLIEAGRSSWTQQMKLLDDYLAAGSPYLAGTSFTIADIPTGLVVNRWFGIEFDKPKLPAVSAYYERLSERPAYRAHGRNGTP